MIFGREPAMVIGLLEAAIALGLAFGLELSPEQIAAIISFMSITFAVLVRSKVTPTDKLEEKLEALKDLSPEELEELKALA